jgi:hypothetical protein
VADGSDDRRPVGEPSMYLPLFALLLGAFCIATT